MRGRLYTSAEKLRAKELVLAGKNYREIKEILGVPKSTLSVWFGKTIKKPVSRAAMLAHLTRIRKLASTAISRKFARIREAEQRAIEERVKQELVNFPRNERIVHKALIAMLYWAEGARYEGVSGLKFANTDPNLALLFLTLLRKCYKIDEKKLAIGLYIHHYHSIKDAKKFWSKLLNIPLTQFHKVYIKKRSKTRRFRKNFMGICFIYYGSSMIRKELMELASSLQKHIIKAS